jgi:hypothetical protein
MEDRLLSALSAASDKLQPAMNWPDLVVGGVIGAAITLGVAYLFYVLQTKRASPTLASRSFSWPIVARSEQDGSRDIEIRYRGSAIPRLSRSRIAVWNPGWAVIDAENVAEADPLAFRFRDGEVLDADVVSTNRAAPMFEVDVVEGACVVRFDFLDHEDGAMIDVLHTAQATAPSWSGTAKGMPKTPRTSPIRKRKAASALPKVSRRASAYSRL